MLAPLLYSLGICIASAVLEGVFAGSGIRARLAEVRAPRGTPPLAAWIGIGLGYYAICGLLLYRLFALPATTAAARWALGLLLAMMFMNAAWNWFFSGGPAPGRPGARSPAASSA